LEKQHEADKNFHQQCSKGICQGAGGHYILAKKRDKMGTMGTSAKLQSQMVQAGLNVFELDLNWSNRTKET
jgi:hypothetical protein